MTVLAGAGDTWGIAGPAFLQIYLVLAVAALLLGVLMRSRTLRGGDGDASRPNPVEVAYLNRGDSLAVQTAVAGLRAAGAVDAAPGGTMVAVGPFPAGAGDLDYAVHSALATPRRLGDLLREPGLTNALHRMRDRLTDAGLMVSPDQRRDARLAGAPLFIVLAVGIARLMAGLAGHKAVGLLVFLDILTLVACVRLMVVPRLTRAGRRLLTRLRTGNGHLEPRLAPSWATYGPTGAMLGVALFGTAALWASDPAFATGAGIPPVTSGGAGSFWSGSGGASGDGGGSSCSGGNSCGGGSSCGGGGGCGGGGCGG
jgi:uncharacterized protein (TIGR04222 family)